MPTKPRVDLAGYHHIINRGVNRMDIFYQADDKNMFLQMINKAAIANTITLHDYVFMDNHYHLLIETQEENLSTFMRTINANYAQYFNKKYQRSGHLWQDRYKSKYIIAENYLYTLIRYIEYNPIEAKITTLVGEYPYTLDHVVMHDHQLLQCTQNSLLLTTFDRLTLNAFLGKPMEEDERTFLEKREKQKVEKSDKGIVIKQSIPLEQHFEEVETKEDRNLAIVNAYLDGYLQVEIANYLSLSRALVSSVIKSKSELLTPEL
jgi:REP element-mobilizing transposase RayT